MKQLLFPLLFLPCLALAQYPANANQKITLGEQTTADGLIFRGVASADTVAATSKITRANKQDTSAYLLLDTITNLLWHYKIGSNAWLQAGGGTAVTSITGGTGLTGGTITSTGTLAADTNFLVTRFDTSSMLTNYWRAGRFAGTLPVSNGGTGSATQNFVDLSSTQSSIGGAKTFTSAATFSSSVTAVGAINVGTSGSLQINASGAQTPLLTQTTNYTEIYRRSGGVGIYLGGTGDEANYYDNTNHYFRTSGGGATRMTINNLGNVGIGTASPSALLNVMGTVRINSASAPDANYYLQLENSSSQKAKANAWDTYSDRRIKTDIKPIVNAIDKVNLLNPVYYQKHDSYVENDFLNIDYDNSVKSLGFIAQEVYNVIPEAVNTGTTNELWAMDYTKIIPILTKAIQEQQALIKALEQRIINLENK